jgi:hypothetical protein
VYCGQRRLGGYAARSQEIGFGRPDEVGAVHLARYVPRERKNGRVIAAGLIEAGDEMGAAGSRRTGADPSRPVSLA